MTQLQSGPLFPAELAVRYRDKGYWNDETFAQLPDLWADRFGENEALVGADYRGQQVRLNYRELRDAIARLSAGLRRLGVNAGDAVVIQLPNITDYVVAVFAVFRLGAVPVFTLPAHRAAEISHFLRETGATAYIGVGKHAGFEYVEMIQEVVGDLEEASAHTPKPSVVIASDRPLPAGVVSFADLAADQEFADAAVVDPEALAFLQLSGGTTGTPKLIPRSHADYWYSVRGSIPISALTQDSRMLVVLPASHNFTMSSPGILGVLGAGGTCVMCPDPTPSTGFGLIEREQITITALVPPLATAWLNSFPRIDADISSLQVLQVGGAKLVEETARRVRPELGCTLQQVFGMAEGLVNYTRLDDPEETIVCTQGRPISPDDEIRIVSSDGQEVAPGQRGALLTRGPYTIHGYFHGADPGAFTEDGFYGSGDLVRMTSEGYLVVEGRIKDQINRAGEKVSAEELENHIIAHPAIHDAAVVGIPDKLLGESTCAYVLTEDVPANSEAWSNGLRRWLRDERGLAAYKIPDRIVVAENFPLTGVGKLSRKVLRAHLRELLV